MNRIARKVSVALLVILVPPAIYHAAGILTFLMNATSSPFGYARHADLQYGDEPAHRLDVYVPKAAAPGMPDARLELRGRQEYFSIGESLDGLVASTLNHRSAFVAAHLPD